MMVLNEEIRQEWEWSYVFLSYIVALFGSYTSLQLVEQWRLALSEDYRGKLLRSIAVALGGCGIWSMHFIGMRAKKLIVPSTQQELSVGYEVGGMILSLFLTILFVMIGLSLGADDVYFVKVMKHDRLAIFIHDVKITGSKVVESNRRESIVSVMGENKNEKAALPQVVVDFNGEVGKHLMRISGAAIFLATGISTMQYMDMTALHADVSRELNIEMVALSVGVAYITSFAALLILFRILARWPNRAFLQMGLAMLLAASVCCSQYIGIYAGKYIHVPEKATRHGSLGVVDNDVMAKIVSHVSLLLCYVLSTVQVVDDLRLRRLLVEQASNLAKVESIRNSKFR